MKLTALTLLFLASLASAQDSSAVPLTSSAQAAPTTDVHRGLLVSGNGSYNARRGYFEISGYRQDSIARPLGLWEFSIGVRAHNDGSPWLRRQFLLVLGRGSVDYDTIYNVPLTDGTIQEEVALTQDFLHLGFKHELHFLLPAAQIFTPYFIMGGGVNFVRFNELGRVGSGLFRQAIRLEGGAESAKWSLDVHGGVGLDVALGSAGAGMTFAYTFTYWQPVNYVFDTDMPLDGFVYWETFRSHGFALGLTWQW